MTEQEVRRFLRQMREEEFQIAFKHFYDLCYDRFFRIAYYYLRRDELAQEVVLDVFLKIWQRKEAMYQIANLEDYFFILVKNASINYLEKEKKTLDSPVEMAEEKPDSDLTESPEERMIGEELFARYVKALDRLPARCREVFIRVREENQTYAQVAEDLDISIKTVDAQLQKAIHRLKEMLL